MFKSSNINEKFLVSDNATKLMKNGYLIIPNVVSYEDCDDITNIIKEVEKTSNKCGNIHSNINRKDMMIPLDKVKKHIKKIYDNTKDVWSEIAPNPILCECSSLISYPGAFPQIWHTDTVYKKGDANLISVGVALKNTTSNMGPLNVYKKSNELYDQDTVELKKKYHVKTTAPKSVDDIKAGLYKQDKEELCKSMKYKKKKCVSNKGDLVVWLSSIVHRGDANISDESRPVFYFSMLSSNGNKPYGSTYSLIDGNKKIYIDKL